MCGAREHVRFTPNSDHKSRHAALVMSALHLKADMCGANRHVCFGPKADIGPISDERSNARQNNLDLREFARLRIDLD
jgi:hypothetical protein